MILALGPGEQLTDVVVAETPAQTERPALGPIRFGWRGRQDVVQSDPQCGVDDLLKRFAELSRGFFGFGGNNGVKRQCGPHADIMMLRAGKSIHGYDASRSLALVVAEDDFLVFLERSWPAISSRMRFDSRPRTRASREPLNAKAFWSTDQE